MVIFYPTTSCKQALVFPVPRRSPKSIEAYVKVGCRTCNICQKEILQAKQAKWRSRLREMILHYQEEGHRVVFTTFTVHDEDMPDYKMMKDRLGGMFKAFRIRLGRIFGDTTCVKYWAVLEYGELTNRLHAHVFFFIDKRVQWSVQWRWLKEYWTERYKAYILHSRLVVGHKMAAGYATKYGVKQVGFKRDRVMSSQFGWINFMERRRKRWLGIGEDVDGVTEWVALRDPDVDRVIAGVGGGASISVLVDEYKDGLEVVGKWVTDKPVLHPFAACPVYVSEEIFKCGESKGVTGVLTIPDYLRWVPGTVNLLQQRQYVSEKLLRVLKRRFGL